MRAGLLLALLLVVVAALTTNPYPGAAGARSVTRVWGLVVDEGDLSPVRGAEVRVYSGEGVLLGVASTGEDGYFSLYVESGPAVVRVRAKGYSEARVETLLTGSSKSLGMVALGRALVVDMPEGEALVRPGSVAEVFVGLANRGWEAYRIGLSLEAPPGWSWAFYAGEERVGGVVLEPGESVSLRVLVGTPVDAEPGSYVLRFSAPPAVDDEPLVVHVGGEPVDLLVAPGVVEARAGEEARLGVVVYNPGLEDAVFRAWVEAPGGWVVRPVLVEGVVGALGGSEEVVFRVEPPLGWGGRATLSVVLELGGSVFEEAVVFNVEPVSEYLGLRVLERMVRVVVGEEVRLPVVLVNKAPVDQVVVLSVEAPGGLEAGLVGPSGAFVGEVGVPGGGEAVLDLVVKAGGPGEYEVVVAGASEYQAVSVGVVVVAEEPEPGRPRVRAVEAVVEVNAGDSVRLGFVVSNEGGEPGVFELEPTGCPEGYVCRVVVDGSVVKSLLLEPGGERLVHVVVEAPRSAGATPAEVVEVGLAARGEGGVHEDSARVLVKPVVELGYGRMVLSSRATPSSVVEVVVPVVNKGGAGVGGLELLVVEKPEGFEVSVEPGVIDRLDPGGEAEFLMRILVPGDAAPGDYLVEFRVVAEEGGLPARGFRVVVEQPREAVVLSVLLIVGTVAAVALLLWRLGRR